jgi:branched-chain amino acid transport system permease protein
MDAGRGGRVTHVQALIDAIGLGAVYALIAVGIGLVFGVLRLVNFAYGQLIMIAAYILVFTDGWPDAASIVVAVLAAVAAAVLMERIAFRPLRNSSPATMLVATFAISFLLQNVALLRYTYENKPVGDSVSTLSSLNRAATIGSLHIRWITIVAIVVGAVALGALALLLARTSIGLQMRAAAADFPTARTLGVRADTVILAAVALSGVLAAAAAVILAVGSPQVTNTTGLNETILVLVGVVVGGVDRLLSATLGGFAIGFATSFLGFELSTQGSATQGAWPFTSGVYLPSLIYVLVILVLLLRPAGLFARRGQAPAERV